MPKLKNIALFTLVICIACAVSAKTPKVNHLEIAQQMINNAYQQGYVDAAPLEMSAIDEKMLIARQAKEKRDKKKVIKLTSQIKADLKIVKKRYEVNKLNLKLLELKDENMGAQMTLDELKAQL